MADIGTLDTGVIVLYLVVVFGLGCLAGIRRKKNAGAEGYFLAGGTLTWPIIGLALFSTNISTVHLVSLAEEGYKNGLVYGNTEWMAAFTLIVLALFFAPFYLKAKVATLPDFLEKRYSKGSRNWLAFLSIISAVFIHIGFTLYTAAVVIKGLFGLNLNVSIITVAVLTGLYTIIGGLLAVVMTETVQTVVLLIGAVCLTVISFRAVGGWDGLMFSIDPDMLSMLRGSNDPSGLPWYAVFLGYPVIGIWYWCTDQTIVQRVLGARNENHARVGPLFAGFIKILPVFILILPGLICSVLIAQGKLPALPLDAEGKPDTAQAYSMMIQNLLPPGLTGVMAASLLAAAMSTVSGALNSIATLFSYDLYKQWRPRTSPRQLVFIGRSITFLAMILAIVWSIYGIQGQGKTIFQQFATIICLLSPPITVTFLLGVFWKKASSFGSLMNMIIGTGLGMLGYVLIQVGKTYFVFDNFWMSSFYLAVICAGVHVACSLLRPDGSNGEKMKLVWDRPLDCLKGRAWPGIRDYRVLSVLLFAVMVCLYWMFR
jgi:SSS family solute:Na+ symporter